MGSTLHNGYSLARLRTERCTAGVATTVRRRSISRVTRGLSSALLATVLAALIVAADRMVDVWSKGGLMLALLVLWLVLFAGLALFGRATGRLALRMALAWRAWSERTAQERADEDLMYMARTDARLMSDLMAALARDEQQGVATRMVGPLYPKPW